MMLFSFDVVWYLTCVVGGLVCLWLAGDRVVRYAVDLAAAAHVSTFFIGFMVLSVAAGLPELSVAISAAYKNASEISAGDIVGANLTDVALVTGLVLFLAGPIFVRRVDRRRLLSMLLMACGALAYVWGFGLTRWSGGVLIGIYLLAFYWLWQKNKRDHFISEGAEVIQRVLATEHKSIVSLWGIFAKLLASIAGVLVCSWITVRYSILLATMYNLSYEVIGATIFAVGTSLPELAMSFAALRRKEYSLALAPTLGAVLEHSLLVLGVLGVCSRKPVYFGTLTPELLFMFGAFFLVCCGLFLREKLGRLLGVFLLILYAFYAFFQLGGCFH